MFYVLLLLSVLFSFGVQAQSACYAILEQTDPALNIPATFICPCHLRDKKMQDLINAMIEIATDLKSKNPLLSSLSAPQIGFQKRMIVVDVSAEDDPNPNFQVFLNPEILSESNRLVNYPEGCCSASQIFGIVPRSDEVVIKAYNRECTIITQTFTGNAARAFQHAIDHLNGIRFPDRIVNDADLHWVRDKELALYQHQWENWPSPFPRNVWEDIKQGIQ